MSRLALTLVVGSLVATGCKSDDTDTDPPGAAWEDAFEPADQGAMFGVWGSGPDDVYMGGGVVGSGSITRYDGSDWAPVSIPASPLLVTRLATIPLTTTRTVSLPSSPVVRMSRSCLRRSCSMKRIPG